MTMLRKCLLADLELSNPAKGETYRPLPVRKWHRKATLYERRMGCSNTVDEVTSILPIAVAPGADDAGDMVTSIVSVQYLAILEAGNSVIGWKQGTLGGHFKGNRGNLEVDPRATSISARRRSAERKHAIGSRL